MPNDKPALLTVRDAAQRLNVTPRTLKYYEERGLVTPTRSGGRYRLYDAQDLERFARILRLRALGFSLHGITEMLKRPVEPVGDGRNRYSLDSLRQIAAGLAQQIDALDARIGAARRELEEAQTVRTELADDLGYVRRRLAGENPDTLIDERLAAMQRRKAAAEDDLAADRETAGSAEASRTAATIAAGAAGSAQPPRGDNPADRPRRRSPSRKAEAKTRDDRNTPPARGDADDPA